MIDTVRNFAIDWQGWASDKDMSYTELTAWTSAIETMAQWADESGELIEELKENGVI